MWWRRQPGISPNIHHRVQISATTTLLWGTVHTPHPGTSTRAHRHTAWRPHRNYMIKISVASRAEQRYWRRTKYQRAGTVSGGARMKDLFWAISLGQNDDIVTIKCSPLYGLSKHYNDVEKVLFRGFCGHNSTQEYFSLNKLPTKTLSNQTLVNWSKKLKQTAEKSH